MAFDAHKNFAISTVAVAPSPPTTGTSLTVTSGEGAVFPAVPFNATVCPPGVLPTNVNAEIVRVTARSGDVLTITRTQENTNARTIAVGDLAVASITAKALTDLETPSFVGNVSTTGSYSEQSRTTPLGYWINTPFMATNFTHAPSGTPLTIAAGNVYTNKYTLIGKTLIWMLQIVGATTSVAGTTGIYLVPPITPVYECLSPTAHWNCNNTLSTGLITTVNSTTILVQRPDNAAITLGAMHLYATMMINFP